GVWSILGGGADIWLARDQFHLTGGKFTGDGTIVAKITHIDNTNAWAKSGVMFRDSAAPGAMFAGVLVTASGKVVFQWRSATDAHAATSKEDNTRLPAWVKIVRT